MTVSREEVTPTEADQEQSIDWVVTGCAAALILAVVLWGVLGGDSFAAFASTALSYVVGSWGWP